MRTLADFVLETVRLAGAEVVFGYPGQSNLALLHAARRAGVRYVQPSDERAAGFAAIGYALSTHKPGVVCVSKGPAATNLLTPLLSAIKDGVPLVVVTGNVASSCHGRNGFQEFDVCTAFRGAGAVKTARYCRDAGDAAAALVQVVESAFTPPFGPALIDIPYDLLAHPCAAEPVRIETSGRAGQGAVLPRRTSDALVARLAAAERPIVIVGCGARREYEAVRAFATAYDCPVVHTMGGTGVIPTTHRLYGGLLRHNGSRTAARLVNRADLVLALGTGLDERATGERARFARGATKIQVDINADVLRRNHFVDVAVNASIGVFLESVSWQLRPRTSRRRWTGELAAPRAMEGGPCLSDGPISAREVIRFASDALEPAIVVKDSGSHKYWVTNLAPCADPSQSIASCHFGAMGFALPAAIGASVGNPGRPVIAALGDGGLLMSLPDLLTAARESCGNLKILVFNNAGLGSTRDYERRAHAGATCISDFDERLSFDRYARAMGIESDAIAARADLPRLRARLRAPGLALLDCAIDPAERFSPSVPYLGPLARLADEDSEYVTTGS